MLIASFSLATTMMAYDWMAKINDKTYVNQISIPGSHDSATGNGWTGFIGGMFGPSSAATQSKTLSEQWDCGIRAFDLRPALSGSDLQIFHGVCQTKLSMAAALDIICSKLDEHPSEFAIILMRHETDGDSNNSGWADALAALLKQEPYDSHLIAYNPRLTVEQLRGKIVILSRDQFSSSKVGFVSGWSHSSNLADQRNASVKCATGSGSIYAQDFYDCTAAGADGTKTAAVLTMNNLASTLNQNRNLLSTWIINHTSGYTKSASSDGNRDLAAKANAALLNALTANNRNPAPTGIVMMDFAGEQVSSGYSTRGQELIDAIVSENFRYTPLRDGLSAVQDLTQDQSDTQTASHPIPAYTISGHRASASSRGLIISRGQTHLIP